MSSATAAPGPEDDRRSYRHRVFATVRFGDLDPMGHLNNVALVRILETGRVDYLVDLRLGTHRELACVLASLQVDFRAQAFYHDELVCGTRTSRLGRTSLTFDQQVWRPADGATVASARSVLVSLGADQAAPAPMPDSWRQRIIHWEPDLVEGADVTT